MRLPTIYAISLSVRTTMITHRYNFGKKIGRWGDITPDMTTELSLSVPFRGYSSREQTIISFE